MASQWVFLFLNLCMHIDRKYINYIQSTGNKTFKEQDNVGCIYHEMILKEELFICMALKLNVESSLRFQALFVISLLPPLYISQNALVWTVSPKDYY